MKAKITRSDGTSIVLDGTREDVVKSIQELAPTPWTYTSIPSVFGPVCIHEYDFPYVGDGHPPCRKCGAIQGTWLSPYTVTVQS